MCSAFDHPARLVNDTLATLFGYFTHAEILYSPRRHGRYFFAPFRPCCPCPFLLNNVPCACVFYKRRPITACSTSIQSTVLLSWIRIVGCCSRRRSQSSNRHQCCHIHHVIITYLFVYFYFILYVHAMTPSYPRSNPFAPFGA